MYVCMRVFALVFVWLMCLTPSAGDHPSFISEWKMMEVYYRHVSGKLQSGCVAHKRSYLWSMVVMVVLSLANGVGCSQTKTRNLIRIPQMARLHHVPSSSRWAGTCRNTKMCFSPKMPPEKMINSELLGTWLKFVITQYSEQLNSTQLILTHCISCLWHLSIISGVSELGDSLWILEVVVSLHLCKGIFWLAINFHVN